MNETTRTLLTIITEASLEKTLSKEIEQLGAKGYTITDARGKGGRGERHAGWDADSNIRIEVICSAEAAKRISSCLKEKFFDDFAMVMYSHEVAVLRSDKF